MNQVVAAVVLITYGVLAVFTYAKPNQNLATRALDRLSRGMPMAVPYQWWLLTTGVVCILSGIAFVVLWAEG